MKLPRGMFRRGLSFYTRLFSGGKDRWVCLGRDYEAAKQQLLRVRLGEAPDVRITVAAAAEQWLATYIETARTTRCRKQARSRVGRYLVPALGDKLLGKVMADDLRGYRLWLERKELEPKTVCNILTDARCLFSWAVDAGLVDTSPVPRRLLPKLQERPPDRLTEEEAERLAVLPEPFGFTIRLGLGTGLRWSELCRAEAAHIERGALVVSETKSRRVRRVPLPPELLREVGSRIGRLVPFDPMQPSNFSAVVRRLSGIEGFHSHQMRHTFACRWLERGGSLAALQQVLGHASVATTQQYARLSDEAVRHEADRLWAQKP